MPDFGKDDAIRAAKKYLKNSPLLSGPGIYFFGDRHICDEIEKRLDVQRKNLLFFGYFEFDSFEESVKELVINNIQKGEDLPCFIIGFDKMGYRYKLADKFFNNNPRIFKIKRNTFYFLGFETNVNSPISIFNRTSSNGLSRLCNAVTNYCNSNPKY